ncbi:MAG: triose-phosphate isomerase [Synergistaceae bacterium]|jgi:triosephosphate isomerase|nr:triose-phosphate isomerase [Synergistaceae bacterium]
MRRKMIAGNWKMHGTKEFTKKFISDLETWLDSEETGIKVSEAIEDKEMEVVIAPPFTALDCAVFSRITGKIRIAAQNAYHERKGAFTGEISFPMLEELRCKYVIIGHSERRHIFGESNKILEKKLIAALESHILPIFCVGELLSERESGNMEKVLAEQLSSAWWSLTSDVVAEMVVIAYEPVWAIGTGKTASSEDADDACDYIRSLAFDKFGAATSDSIRILYGGSVKPENSRDLLSRENIDGLLIGGASLEVSSFKKIIESAL